MRIAILITSYNRKDKTSACLKSIYEQLLPLGVELHIFLTDDNSEDGTSNHIKSNFPKVHLFKGTGELFWAGGMRYTWNKAKVSKPTFYFLLNDDTILKKDAVRTLIDTHKDWLNRREKQAIIIGSTIDDKGKISYGGWKLKNKFGPKSKAVYNEISPMPCDLGNANIMLVPKEIEEKIGILSESYTHGIADYDYTLNAKRNGFAVVVAPGVLGSCVDDHGKNWKPSSSKLSERIQYLYSPKGLAYNEYLTFIKRHFPLHLPSAMLKLWLKTLFPFIYENFKTN
ncbi:glycosyltransferase family 2 protein [Euzebyella marina]|uniref:Glycosyltransferase family 2 protein n=1 Tax=Euzebyella marina TaxID=1761453 RepID=A0A3G2L330_9FLAO|nr:glycosyltransferase family 2 protein [Euzebyella marina]AYN66679.1 glycosyltransferase family 2 protein [Euzebyella marina]